MLKQLSYCFCLNLWGPCWWQASTFDIVFNSVLNWPKWSSQHVSNFMYSDSTVFEDKFLCSLFHLLCLLYPLRIWHFQQRFHHFEFGKITYPLTSESFGRILSQFTAQCDADILSGYAKIVSGTVHSGIQQDVTSTITCATVLLQARNDSRLSLFAVVEIFSGSSSVPFLSFWKLWKQHVKCM